MKNEHWIQGKKECESPLFRRSFRLDEMPEKASLEICGLGYFTAYVNGKRVGDQVCAPAPASYHSVLGCETTYPVWEERSYYRTYYLEFDILPYLKDGENVLGVHLGNGWYHQNRRVAEGKFLFGLPKLHFEINIVLKIGEKIWIESDPQTLWKPSEILDNNLFYGEAHDLRRKDARWCMAGDSQEGWMEAQPVHSPETILTKQDFPSDKIVRTRKPKLILEEKGRKLYDCGENITGWAEVNCAGSDGEKVTVSYSEEVTDGGKHLDFTSTGGDNQIQRDVFICGKKEETVHPEFCWHGFRYFQIEGPGECVEVAVVHTDIQVTSSFRCSDPVLNWLYDTYIRTQLNNFHGCIPSDCPHRERLGYTGDGQLTAEAAMLTMDVGNVYEKWMQDILDSQGAETGHIPHTAPFLGGGGGPGGWGCAIYVIPMTYYKIYGKKALVEMAYPAILKWLEYMDAHSENGLVVREEKGGWCLGDWCMPEGEEVIPKVYVNTYYYIKGLEAAKEAAEILKVSASGWLEKQIARSKKAIKDTYFDTETESFCNGAGGADAFAVQLHIATEKTIENLIKRYSEKKSFDTGIFGTPVLTETLFELEKGNLAIELLTGNNIASYRHMMEAGATTLWESWNGKESHNHPMFGSVVKNFFTEILGIRQKEGSAGFKNYEIRPATGTRLQWAKGSIAIGEETLNVFWRKEEDGSLKVEKKITRRVTG